MMQDFINKIISTVVLVVLAHVALLIVTSSDGMTSPYIDINKKNTQDIYVVIVSTIILE